jgi:N-methylhydantoinase B/oxoprolinase/acetone carboxylase alpha subunit
VNRGLTGNRIEARELPSRFTMSMRRGDVSHQVQPGGGRHGSPLEREPARVPEDVLERRSPRRVRGATTVS